MPMVMNAQKTAAKTDAIWVRALSVILISFVIYRLSGDISYIAETVPVSLNIIITVI